MTDENSSFLFANEPKPGTSIHQAARNGSKLGPVKFSTHDGTED